MQIAIRESASYVFVSVNPDLLSPYGHTLHFDRKLRKAVEADGGQFISLAHKSFEPETEEDKQFILNVFSDVSSSLTAVAGREHIFRYADELQMQCRCISDGFPEKSIVVLVI